MKLCTWLEGEMGYGEKKRQVVVNLNIGKVFSLCVCYIFSWFPVNIFRHLPSTALSCVEQGRVTEERRDHSLNPAGLSSAMELVLSFLVL